MEDDMINSNSDADTLGSMQQQMQPQTGGSPNLGHQLQPLDLGSSATNAFIYRSGSSNTPAVTSSYFPYYKRHVNSSPRKLLIDLNPRYISKMTASRSHFHNSKYRHCPLTTNTNTANDHRSMPNATGPHRMRPYYVPERSRTKSENALDAGQSQSLYPELIGGIALDDDDDDEDDIDQSLNDHQLHHQHHHHHQMDTTTTAGTEVDFSSGFRQPLPLPQLAAVDLSGSSVVASVSAVVPRASAVAAVVVLKKSRSLEDICRGARKLEAGSQTSHEMEFMSSRIQQLKVQD